MPITEASLPPLPPNPIFLAVDTGDRHRAEALVAQVRPYIGGVKIGLQFFTAHGPEATLAVTQGLPLFLDLKFFDVPNTVFGAALSARRLAPAYLTVHVAGGEDMLAAALDGVKRADGDPHPPTKVIGVTTLTSVSATAASVLRRAFTARNVGLHGVVCSEHEVRILRRKLPLQMALVVPGLRMPGDSADDQVRIGTPRHALQQGANVLVVGRSITAARDPVAAAQAVADSIGFGRLRPASAD